MSKVVLVWYDDDDLVFEEDEAPNTSSEAE